MELHLLDNQHMDSPLSKRMDSRRLSKDMANLHLKVVSRLMANPRNSNMVNHLLNKATDNRRSLDMANHLLNRATGNPRSLDMANLLRSQVMDSRHSKVMDNLHLSNMVKLHSSQVTLPNRDTDSPHLNNNHKATAHQRSLMEHLHQAPLPRNMELSQRLLPFHRLDTDL